MELFHKSPFPNRGIEVHNRLGHGGQRGQSNRVERRIAFPLTDGNEFFGTLRFLFEKFSLFFQQLLQQVALSGIRPARGQPAEDERNLLFSGRAAFSERPLGQHARGFDKLLVVEQHESLLRSCSGGTFGGAKLA